MFFSIEPNNGVAIYEQLMRQVKFAVAEKTLKPGQLLPSVRILSQQLAVNPNTITKAFQQLQGEGVLESVRGRGIAVQSDALERCMNDRRTLIAERFRVVLAEALQAGYSESEIFGLVKDQLRELCHLQAENRANSGQVGPSVPSDVTTSSNQDSSPKSGA